MDLSHFVIMLWWGKWHFSFIITLFWTLLNPCNCKILFWLHCKLRWWSHHWSYGRYFQWARPHWILLLGPICWISHFGPKGHEFESLCVSPVFTDRAELFPPWAFVGVEVMGSTRTVQMLGPVLFGYWWSKCQCLWELSQLISFDFGLLLDLATKCFLFATMKNLTTKPKK